MLFLPCEKLEGAVEMFVADYRLRGICLFVRVCVTLCAHDRVDVHGLHTRVHILNCTCGTILSP